MIQQSIDYEPSVHFPTMTICVICVTCVICVSCVSKIFQLSIIGRIRKEYKFM